MNEFDIIDKYFYRLVKTKEALNLKDDCAVIESKNKIVINVDTIVEEEHFFTQDSPNSIAHKLLNVNLSDIASMGATPKYWTMAITIPKNRLVNENWLKEFCNTLESIQKEHNFYLISGDTTFTKKGKLTITANLFAEVAYSVPVLKKSSINIGDVICVSGSIGDAYWGCFLRNKDLKNKKDTTNLLNEDKNYLINKYLYPQARVKLGKILINYATACTDISDGLWADVEKMCKYSGVLGVINIEDVPISGAVNNIKISKLSKKNKLIKSITGGDDYELVFSISKEKLKKLQQELTLQNIYIKQIGYIENKKEKDKYISFLYKNAEITTLKKGYNY